MCDQSCTTPPSTHAVPSHARPMIAVRFNPCLTRTPALRRLARRTITAPGIGSRFAAEPSTVICRISSIGGMVVREVRHQPELQRVEHDDDRHAHQCDDEDQLPTNRLVDMGQGADCQNGEHRRTRRTRRSAARGFAILPAPEVSGRGAGAHPFRLRHPRGSIRPRGSRPECADATNRRPRSRRLARRVVLGASGAAARRRRAFRCWSSICLRCRTTTRRSHDDADYVRGALDSIEGEAVLVGHSYGGAVITDAGVHPNVAHLVYLCGFALEVGESASENTLAGGDGPNDLGAALRCSVTVCSRSIPSTRSPRSTTTARRRLPPPRSTGCGRSRSPRSAARSRPRPGGRSRQRTSCAPRITRVAGRVAALERGAHRRRRSIGRRATRRS